jgi:hypothetical protein
MIPGITFARMFVSIVSCPMEYPSVQQFRESSNSAPEVISTRANRFVTSAVEPAHNLAPNVRCLWCERTFTLRATGGSPQRFCCKGHRQQFWIAARRWTMRAIEARLLSVDCLKASHRACTLPDGRSGRENTAEASGVSSARV